MGAELAVMKPQQGEAQLPALSVDQVAEQVVLVQRVMQRVMKRDEHYGVIPGTGDKPSLLKPGAEKLAHTFMLAPDYEIQRFDLPGGHREYEVVCKIASIATGHFLGSGVGSCSTMEGKYRYRWENTGRPVPREYWDTKDPALLGGPSYATRKVKGRWIIFHKVEHDNPADYYNTVKKMAKKRAFVDAVLTVTAASDIFTQDVEDLKANGVIEAEYQEAQAQASRPERPAPNPQAAQAPPKPPAQGAPPEDGEWRTQPMTDSQRNMLFGKARHEGPAGAEEAVRRLLEAQDPLTKGQASAIIDRFMKGDFSDLEPYLGQGDAAGYGQPPADAEPAEEDLPF